MMDVRLIRPLIAATDRVFTTMLACPCSFGKPQGAMQLPGGAGTLDFMVRVDGDACGAFLVRFPVDTASAATEGLSSQADAPGKSDANAIVGMIVAIARRSEALSGARLSRPLHVQSCSHRSRAEVAKLHPWLTIPVNTALGDFTLAFSLQERRHAPCTTETQAAAHAHVRN